MQVVGILNNLRNAFPQSDIFYRMTAGGHRANNAFLVTHKHSDFVSTACFHSFKDEAKSGLAFWYLHGTNILTA